MALLIIGKCLKKNWKFSCRKPKSISAKEIAGRDTREPLFACRTVDAAIASAMTSVLPRLNFYSILFKFKATTFYKQTLNIALFDPFNNHHQACNYAKIN